MNKKACYYLGLCIFKDIRGMCTVNNFTCDFHSIQPRVGRLPLPKTKKFKDSIKTK